MFSALRSPRLCSHPGCSREYHAGGYCKTHYNNMIKREKASGLHRCVPVQVSDFRAKIMASLNEGPKSSNDLAFMFGCPTRQVSSEMVAMSNLGMVTPIGVSKRANHGKQSTIWALAGETRTEIIAKPREVKPTVAVGWPATLTGMLCGDPAPGRSALDQKRAGAVA